MQDGTVVASGHVIPASGPHKAAAACVTTDGSTVWSRTYEGTTSRTFSDGTASDHGIVLAGRINDDAWLVELDMNGDTLWTRSFGGSGSDAGTSVARADDGGYIMVGSTDSYGAGGTDIYVIKTDCRGNTRGPVRKLD